MNQKIKNSKHYDLEDRTLEFAKLIRIFIKRVSKTTSNIEDCKQLSRSSGSIGSNYIEANESLSKKDFIFRIKICRKEAKETIYWLKLIDVENEDLDKNRNHLVAEATELLKIFSSILNNSK